MSKTLKDFKTCTACKVVKEKQHFSKRTTYKDGHNYTCKVCINSHRKSKGTVSKEEALKFQEDLVLSGEVFECRSCKVSKGAGSFYTKRDYGKVTLVTSKCSQCQIDHQLFKSFGVTAGGYLELLKVQGGNCAICRISEEEYKTQGYRNRFAVDHDHTTKEIRGLLCDKCNRGIGYLQDSIENLKSAITYLS